MARLATFFGADSQVVTTPRVRQQLPRAPLPGGKRPPSIGTQKMGQRLCALPRPFLKHGRGLPWWMSDLPARPRPVRVQSALPTEVWYRLDGEGVSFGIAEGHAKALRFVGRSEARCVRRKASARAPHVLRHAGSWVGGDPPLRLLVMFMSLPTFTPPSFAGRRLRFGLRFGLSPRWALRFAMLIGAVVAVLAFAPKVESTGPLGTLRRW